MIPSLVILFSAGFLLPEVSSQLATCFNAGTPLNSTDCKCPGFVSGKLCETVNCQRFSIPDKNRCVCPPGWYDKYCGIRGCRPPNEENLDLQKRSFILVINAKTSMRDQIQTLRDNFNQMIGEITKNHTDNWIANYIIYGFVQTNQHTNVSKTITENPDEAMDFLGRIELQDGDSSQPVLTALKNAQQTFPQMKSHAVVLVLTDSPASEATPWSHRFSDKNMEQSCLQISLLWRSKVSFLLSLPNGTDSSSDGVDVYRRLSLTNHGDTFFLQQTSELRDVLLTIIGVQYYPEVLASGYGSTGDVTVSFPDDQESSSNTLYYLVTVDSPEGMEVPSIAGLSTVSQGHAYKLYTRPASANKGSSSSVTIVSGESSRYNYRIFIQSKTTIMFDYNDDMHIDVGNGMAVIGIPMSSTMQTFGFSEWTNSTYEVRSSTGALIREAFNSYSRPQLDCTFQYGFPAWDTLSCPPGPITQTHKFYYKGEYRHQRVTAGYCIESDHNEQHPDGIGEASKVGKSLSFGNKVRARRNEMECGERNIAAISDARLGVHNQFIFILEQHSGNANIYKTLSADIRKIVELAVNTTSSETYQKEFSLIIHNDIESRVLLSSYDPKSFIDKFTLLSNSISLHDNLDETMGLLSVVQAQKINIRPTAQVFYFTNQGVMTVKNVSRNWDLVERDIEVNFLTVADGTTSNIFALPPQLELVRKMTSGRIVPLQGNETTLLGLFTALIAANVLTTDEMQQDCSSAPITVDGFIERDAESVVLQVVGAGLRYVRILDASGNSIPAANFISYENRNIASLNIDISSFEKGVWKISTLTTTGGCQISVRQRTKVGVMLGFTSSKSDDAVSTEIITQRTASAQPIYAPIRVNTAVVPTRLEIQVVDRDGVTTSFYNSSVYQRDSDTCSYNFISEDIVIPKTAITSWIISSFDDSGALLLHRIFYYYQHSPADTSVCQGNEVDEFGRCICPPGFTGDYCWDRICQPAATYSYGICSCPPGYYGDFCEIELVLNQTTTRDYPSNVVATSPIIETTTGTAPNNFNIYMGTILLIMGHSL